MFIMPKPTRTQPFMLKLIHSNTCIYYIFYRWLHIPKGSLYLKTNQTASYLIGGKQKNQIYKEH